MQVGVRPPKARVRQTRRSFRTAGTTATVSARLLRAHLLSLVIEPWGVFGSPDIDLLTHPQDAINVGFGRSRLHLDPASERSSAPAAIPGGRATPTTG